jgi:glucan phosphoethanolaminetransferase (alkaline phosphatase superfamily)
MMKQKNKFIKGFIILLGRLILIPLIYIALFMLPDIMFSFFNEYYNFEFTFIEVKKLYVFVLLLTFLKPKYQKIIINIFLFFIFLQLSYFNFFGKLITPYDILLFFMHYTETFNAFRDIYNILIIPFIIILIIGFIFNKIIDNLEKYNLIYNFKYAELVFFLSLLSIFFIIYNKVYIKKADALEKYPQTTSTALRNFIRSFSYFIVVTLPKHLNHKQVKYNFKTNYLIRKTPNVNVILILGESFRYKNAGIFEENNLTNMPLLTQLKKQNKIIAKKAYSSGTMTKVSVSYIMHQVKDLVDKNKIYDDKLCLFYLAKNNGFFTIFFSDQSKDMNKYIYSYLCPKYVDLYLTPDKYSHKNYFTSQDDKYIIKFLKSYNGLEPFFAVFQMNASHMPYSNKYPQNFKKFNNDYDNSILYTDYILYNVIQAVKNFKKPTILFFVSDHGEMLGEKGLRGHGFLEKEVYTVPFIYYANFKNLKIENLLKSSIFLTHYDISQMIVYLLGYKSNLDFVKNHKKIFIMGKDMDGLAGYIYLKKQKN